jgi:hypothetical protein
LYAGLDLSRQRLDVHVLDEEGRTVEVLAVHPDADVLRTLANRILCHGQEVSAVIESMTGCARGPQTLNLWLAEALAARPWLKPEAVTPVASIPTSARPAGWSEARSQGPIRRSSSTAVGPWPWRVPPMGPGVTLAQPAA